MAKHFLDWKKIVKFMCSVHEPTAIWFEVIKETPPTFH